MTKKIELISGQWCVYNGCLYPWVDPLVVVRCKNCIHQTVSVNAINNSEINEYEQRLKYKKPTQFYIDFNFAFLYRKKS